MSLSGRTTISSHQGPLNKADPDGTRFQLILGKGKALKLLAPDKPTAKIWKDALRGMITIASPTRTTMVGNSTWTIDTRYTLKRKIGQGAFGQV